MNKKRYIIVIVLLLFIGLGIFTFANPSGETNELSGNNVTSNETDTNDNTTTNTTNDDKEENSNITINQNNNNTQNNNANNNNQEDTTKEDADEDVVDEAYNKALAAVIEAEEKLTEDAYSTAMGLVKELDETNPNKEDLESRLSEVNNEMLVALVETLKEMTLDALEDKAKEDLDAARDFRTDEKVVEKVAALENDLGAVLANILNELAKTLDDVKGPEFNIEDGALLNSITTIEVKDAEENEIISLILVDKDGVETPVTEGLEVVDGTYTLIAMDAALNESEVTFTIDTIKPEVEEVKQEYEAKEGGRIKLTVVFSEEVVYPFDTLNWRQVSETEYYTYFYRTKDYTINFADLAGNENSYTLAVDKTAPVPTNFRFIAYGDVKLANSIRYVNNEDRVMVYLTLNEEARNVIATINGKEMSAFSNKVNEDGTHYFAFEYYLAENDGLADGMATFKVTGTDVIGNPFELTEANGTTPGQKWIYIDRTAPAVESLRIMAHNAKMDADYVRYVNNGDRVLVYLTLSEQSYNVVATINGLAMNQISDKLNEDGTHYVAFDYYLSENDGLEDGMATFKITGTDFTGNPFEYTEADGTLGSQQYVYIDRTAPAVDSLRIIAHNAKMDAEYVRYVNNGDRVLVYLTLNEESYNVAATINGLAMNMISNKVNEDGSHYVAFDYTLKAGDGLEDGMATFKITGTDFTGNPFEYTEADGTLGSQQYVYIDRTISVPTNLRFMANGDVKYRNNIRYVNNGDRVLVYLTLSEESYNVVATINGLAMKQISNKVNEDGSHYVAFDYTLKAGDGLADGMATFKITGEDRAGNPFELTEANGTLASQKWVYIDRTTAAPTNLRFMANGNVSFRDNIRYASNGSRILVYLTLDDKSYNVAATINGLAMNKISDTVNADGSHYVAFDYYVSENDGLESGMAKFKITGTDFTGNPFEYTENDGTLASQKYVYIDKTVRITLTEDTVLEDLEIPSSQITEIDLNGKRLIVSDSDEAVIDNNGKLTIKNGTLVNNSNDIVIENNDGGELVIDNVNFDDNGSNGGATIYNNGGKVTITDSSFDLTPAISGSKRNPNAAIIQDSGELVVKNTTITGKSDLAYGIKVNDGTALIEDVTIDHTRGGLNIYGGTVTVNNANIVIKEGANGYYAIYIANVADSNVTINGGIFNGHRAGLYVHGVSGYTGNVKTLVNGGVFSHKHPKTSYSALIVNQASGTKLNVVIKGGTFNKDDVTAYLAPGYKQNADWSVTAE